MVSTVNRMYKNCHEQLLTRNCAFRNVNLGCEGLSELGHEKELFNVNMVGTFSTTNKPFGILKVVSLVFLTRTRYRRYQL